ncbi:MAG: hypothetical protein R3B40_20400 [Polyangiales bacterium]
MGHRHRSLYFVFVLIGLLAPAGGCEEDPIDPPPPDPFGDLYASATFQMCADCHSPTAPGFVQGTETTQNWSSRGAAFTSLQGNAAGLEGNFAGCNGVPLVGDTAETSLIVAVLDPTVRASFSVAGFPDCTADAIADETLRVGSVPAATLQALKDFIDDGGFD